MPPLLEPPTWGEGNGKICGESTLAVDCARPSTRAAWEMGEFGPAESDKRAHKSVARKAGPRLKKNPREACSQTLAGLGEANHAATLLTHCQASCRL